MHFRKICSSCGKLIAQCRCMSCNKETLTGLCINCGGNKEDIMTIKKTFEDYVKQAQAVNESPASDRFAMDKQRAIQLKQRILDYLDQIFDVSTLTTIENFVESKISGDSSMRFDDYGDGD